MFKDNPHHPNIDASELDAYLHDAGTSALDRQEGGTHYKDMVIQPIEYAQKNKLNACEFMVVKYVSRHANKNRKADLLKAIHSIELLIELEYGDE